MALPATPAPDPRDPDSPTDDSRAKSDAEDGSAERRRPVDLLWRPVWRGEEPDHVDQLLTPRH